MSDFDKLKYTLDSKPISAKGLMQAAGRLDAVYAESPMKFTSTAACILREHGHEVREL